MPYTITFTDKATGERAADPRKADSGIAAKLTIRWFARTQSEPFTAEVTDDRTGEVAIYYDGACACMSVYAEADE